MAEQHRTTCSGDKEQSRGLIQNILTLKDHPYGEDNHGRGEVLSNKTSKNTVKITHKIKVFITGWGIKPTTHRTSYRGPDAPSPSARGSRQRRGHLCTYKPRPGGCVPPARENCGRSPTPKRKPLWRSAYRSRSKPSFNHIWKYQDYNNEDPQGPEQGGQGWGSPHWHRYRLGDARLCRAPFSQRHPNFIKDPW